MELDRAVDPGRQGTVGIWYVDFGEQRPCARLQRIGNSRHFAFKAAVGYLGDANNRFGSGGQSERRVLRHIDPDADHIALHDGEHERPGCRIGLHESADIDISLSDDAVERRYDTQIGLLLIENLELRLFRRISVRSLDRLLCLESLNIDVALLMRNPPFLDKRLSRPW